MPITFDTLEELKAFYCSFKMAGSSSTAPAIKKTPKAPSLRKKVNVPSSKTTARKTGKPSTLTAKIQSLTQEFLEENRPFTNNDLYEALAKREKGLNKASVITAISKQMNTQYAHIPFTEQRGRGPRPIKVYNS